jgi:hypothetical protein
MDSSDDIASQHYAFLVNENEFDEIFGRIRQRGLSYWADPYRREGGRINEWDGGRGVCWRSSRARTAAAARRR